MKTNSTLYSLLLCVALTFISLATKSQTSYQLNFSTAPTLISGTAKQVGAQYRFTNVCSGTDAIVSIISASGGASIDVFDDNTITKPEAFSPNILVPANHTGLVEFKFDLVKTGTNTSNNQDSLYATGIDIDGISPSIKEIDVIDLGGGAASYMVANPEINLTQIGSAFTGKNVAGINYPGIDTSAREVMFTVKEKDVKSFTYKCGAQNDGSSDVIRLKSIYFKNFIYPAGTLPVKYTSFDAVVVEKSVILKWITEQEISNNHFVVERSFDGTNFTTIGIVLDGFESGTKKSYEFKDNIVELQSKSVVYYRLKQVDNNSKITYTNTLLVKLKAADGVVIQTSPNPFIENLNIRFTSGGNSNALISIINSNGQQVLKKQSNIGKGYNNIQVDGLAALASGMYIVRLTMDGVVTGTQKIIKN